METGLASRDKLAQVGVEDADEDGDEAIFALKQEVAARANRDYGLIAGAVPTGSGVAQGTNGAFTKSIASYLTGGAVAEAKAVAFVNFADLDPRIDDDPVDPLAALPWRKRLLECGYVVDTQVPANGGVGNPNWPNVQWYALSGMVPPSVFSASECGYPYHRPVGREGPWPPIGPDPDHPHAVFYQRSNIVSSCSEALITPVEGVGSMTSGVTDSTTVAWADENCPGGPTSFPTCTKTVRHGAVTMNATTVAGSQCDTTYEDNVGTRTLHHPRKMVGVCCKYDWTRQ